MLIRSYGAAALASFLAGADRGPRVKLLPETEAWLLDVAPPHFASDESPTTYDEVRDHWTRHKMFHVFNGGSTDTMFSERRYQYAYRAWHDSIHMKYEIPFEKQDELTVAKLQEAIALRHDVDPHDARLLCLDLEAHIKYYYAKGEHPVRQLELIRDCMANGVEATVNSDKLYH